MDPLSIGATVLGLIGSLFGAASQNQSSQKPPEPKAPPPAYIPPGQSRAASSASPGLSDPGSRMSGVDQNDVRLSAISTLRKQAGV